MVTGHGAWDMEEYNQYSLNLPGIGIDPFHSRVEYIRECDGICGIEGDCRVQGICALVMFDNDT